MTAPQAQPNSAPDKTANAIQQDGNHRRAAALPPHDPGSGPGTHDQITEEDTQPNNGRGFRAKKYSLQDHAQWSAYLQSRHILEPAIAAGAWVEYSDHYGRNCLISQENRHDGSPGARLRHFIDPPVINGKKIGKSIWFAGEKTDEPFHYVGSLDELKRAIAHNGGAVYIVEGLYDVWSLHVVGLPNTVGIYGISNIPKDIASILDELGAAKVVYLADNDMAGERGASDLRTRLHKAGWTGTQEFRKVTGPGIPEKGDSNDLLCQHHPDLAAARAALDALPTFLPHIEPEAAPNISIPSGDNDPRWDAIKEAVRIALDVTRYNRKGFSKKHFRCLDPQHEDPGPSANWHKDGFCHCFGCGKDFNAKEMAEWLGIPWRALLGTQSQILSSDNIDLNALPRQLETASAPLFFDEPPDSLLRLSNRVYSTMYSALYYYATRGRSAGLLPEEFSIQELIEAAQTQGCELKERSIYDNFEEARRGDEHPFFAKFDPSAGARSWNVKFRLRSVDDIQDRLLRCLRFRVYEEKFQGDRNTIIGFEVFAAAPLGSESAKALELALEPLIEAQKLRYERLVRKCEDIIARRAADLADRQATPLPANWKIRKKSDLPAGKARAIFNADGKNRSRAQWKELLGIGTGSVGAVLDGAGIGRTAVIKKVTVKSKHELLTKAAKEQARIKYVDNQPFDAAMEIRGEVTATLQPPAEHEIISAGQPEIRPTPAKPQVSPEPESKSERAKNMAKPGNWRKTSWDPQFRYWELVKICRLKHGYKVKEGVGIYDPETRQIWTNPSLSELVSLITGIEPDDSEAPT